MNIPRDLMLTLEIAADPENKRRRADNDPSGLTVGGARRLYEAIKEATADDPEPRRFAYTIVSTDDAETAERSLREAVLHCVVDAKLHDDVLIGVSLHTARCLVGLLNERESLREREAKAKADESSHGFVSAIVNNLKPLAEAFGASVEPAQSITTLPVGATVSLGDGLRGTVTAVCVRAGKAAYEVAWWNGREREVAWLEPCEVAPEDGGGRAVIGFRGESPRPSPPVPGPGPGLSDEAADAILRELDEKAREENPSEYGLPIYFDLWMSWARIAVREAFRKAAGV